MMISDHRRSRWYEDGSEKGPNKTSESNKRAALTQCHLLYARNKSLDERLDLFMQVCHAIQHARQKGIERFLCQQSLANSTSSVGHKAQRYYARNRKGLLVGVALGALVSLAITGSICLFLTW